MLYLTRKIGESVIINDEIEVTVVDIRGKSIKLGFNFPSDASVLRREIHDRIQEENRAAAGGADAFAAALGRRDAPDAGTGSSSDSDEGSGSTGSG
jgi:carbon storage regulator